MLVIMALFLISYLISSRLTAGLILDDKKKSFKSQAFMILCLALSSPFGLGLGITAYLESSIVTSLISSMTAGVLFYLIQ